IEQSVSIDIPSSDLSTIHRVHVDGGDEVAFKPNRVNTNIDDKVVFKFLRLNHTLTQSMIGQPCTSAQQLNSGFKNFNPTNRIGLTLSITVNSPNSQWFFCQQNTSAFHCHAGMVFALNPGDHMKKFLRNVRRESALMTTHNSTISVESQGLPFPALTAPCSTVTSLYPGIVNLTSFYPGTAGITSSYPGTAGITPFYPGTAGVTGR
ncbi:hypothetical protein AJ78_09048, partial [Emergomyces pasteurianus Ep9510]